MATDQEFDALAERLTDPATPMPQGARSSAGAAAANAGHSFLVREFGSEAALDTALRSAGRTRLGEHPRGESPTVRGRLAEADFAAFKLLEERTGKKQSELVREAVQLLLKEHAVV